MIDSHCHFDFDVFDDDRAKLVQECQQRGVSGLLIPGVSSAQWRRQQQLQQQYCQFIDLAYGLHPYFLNAMGEDDLSQLEQLLSAQDTSAVAVGEIGLDFSEAVLSKTSKEAQIGVFEEQLRLATNFQLPVILHHRKSHNDLIRLLKAHRFDKGGVVHAFSGSLHEAKEYIDLGFCLGIGGTITYPRAQRTRNVVAELPASALLLETDAPDMPLLGYQGQRNSPTRLPLVAQALAELRSVSLSDVEAFTCANYARVFSRSSLSSSTLCN